MSLKVRIFGPGQTLFTQGDTAEEMYILRKGEVELWVRNEKTATAAAVATVGPNAVLGVMSFLEGEPRSATGITKTEVEVVVIDQSQREKLIKEIPDWARVMIKEISGNLRSLNLRFTDLQKKYEEALTHLSQYSPKETSK